MKPRLLVALALFGTGSVCRAEDPRGNALWVEPIALAVVTAAASSYGQMGLYLPLGAQIGVRDAFSVGLELTAFGSRPNGGNCSGTASFNGCWSSTVGGGASLGATWHFTGTNRSSGFWLGTKLMGAFATEKGQVADPSSDFGFEPGTATSVGVGLDLGYQWVLQRLYLSAVIGVTGELCTHCDRSPLSAPVYLLSAPSSWRSDQTLVWPNVNLVRVGFTL